MRAYLRHLDYMLLATAAAISTYGLWIIRNATRTDVAGNPSYYYSRKIKNAAATIKANPTSVRRVREPETEVICSPSFSQGCCFDRR